MLKNPVSSVTRLLTGFFLFLVVQGSACAAGKTTLFVPLDDLPSWRDMAFLAAVPASEMANPSGGSLIALDPALGIGPEIQDYLRRYQPDSIHLIGNAEPFAKSSIQITALPAASAEGAALRLSRSFWKTSGTVVICKDDDYGSALVAAPLATRLKAPLLYSTASGVSTETLTEIKRLGAHRVLTIGPTTSLAHAIHLADAKEVMKWTKEQGVDVNYIAAVNPLDRTTSKVRKLSLVGAQLAAGRQGLVAPLPFAVEWKKPFKSKPAETELPKQFQNQDPPARTGTLQAGPATVPYMVTGKPNGRDMALFIDRDASGTWSGPIHTGDAIELEGRKWTVSLGAGSSYHDSDVHITWPQPDIVKERLQEYYGVLGLPPTYLCLIGLPDAVPQGIVRGHLSSPDVTTDLPYAMPDGEPSSQIAVGRVVAEDVGFGSLYAARVLTYQELLDDEWVNRACQAEWENSFAPLFANVGFDASYRLTDEDIPWAEKPTKGKRGKPGPGFTQDSPITRAKILAHMNHSWNFELGRTMKWDATARIAPTVVESGGCGTTSLDRSAPGQLIVEGATGAQSPELAVKHRSVVSRLFRLGAVSFAGGSREMTAQQLPLRQEFWSGVLSGQSVGLAHRRSQNTGFLILKEKGNGHGAGGYRHNLHARTLLGDPAVTIQLPGPPRSAPARTVLDGNQLTVHAPEKWETVKLFVPPDWKKWVDRDIFVLRAVGAYSWSHWGPQERDIEVPFVLAEFQSDKKIKSLTLRDEPKKPLGWSGIWHTNRNRDGSYTHRFGIRMIDFNQKNGEVLQALERLEFSVSFE